MGAVAFQTLLVLIFTLVTTSHQRRSQWPPRGTYCAPCTCSYSVVPEVSNSRCKLASCVQLSLSAVPMYLPSDVEFLDLAGNHISGSLDVDQLSRYRSLKGLRVANNGLNSLHEDLFYNLTRLQYLDFEGNRFETVPAQLFNGTRIKTIKGFDVSRVPDNLFWGLSPLRNLYMTLHQRDIPGTLFKDLSLHKASLHLINAITIPENLFFRCNISMSELHICGKRLVELHEDLYKPLTVVQDIKIDTQGMSTLPASLFNELWFAKSGSTNDFRRLKKISIEGVQSLPPTIFHGLQYLEHLELHELKSTMDTDIFSGLSTLASLDLSRNNFTDLAPEWFEDLFRLKSLNLSHNSLHRLIEDDFRELGSLDVLDMSYNNISSIDPMYFWHFRMELDELDLSHNSLCQLPEDLFPEMYDLKILKLDHNCLHSLPESLLDQLQSLKRLQLQSNRLETLVYEHFQYLHDLVELDLSENLIKQLGDYAFYDLNAVKELDLSQNRLGILPVEIFSVDALLENVKLSGNPIHCDCGIVPMLYLSSHINTHIEGNCTAPEKHAGRDMKELTIWQVCPRSIHAEVMLGGESSTVTVPESVEEIATSDTGTTTSPMEPGPTSTEEDVLKVWPPKPWNEWLEESASDGGPLLPGIRPVQEDTRSITQSSWFQGIVATGTSAIGLSLLVLLAKKIQEYKWSRSGRSYVVNSR